MIAGVVGAPHHGIDSGLDILVRQGGGGGIPSPNGGELNTIGSLGLDATSILGFDIAENFGDSAELAYAAITGPGGIYRLYTINLATGRASQVGIIGGGELIVGISVRP